MNKVVQVYEFDFKFTDKNASKQLKAISKDVAQLMAEMGDAADKVTIFKDLVSYLGNLDKALTAFRSEHKDDFANLFGDVDKILAKEMANVFGVLEDQASTFANLRQRIVSAQENKSDLSKLRQIAHDINSLYESMGQAKPIDVDTLFKGNGSEKMGTSFQQRIDILNNALGNFALTFQDVQDRVKAGLFSGTNVGDILDKTVPKALSQYDKLKKKIEDYYDILDKRNKEKPGSVQYDGLDADLDDIVNSITKMKSLNKADTLALKDIFGDIEYGEIQNAQEALEKVCDILSIQIPSATGGSGGTFGNVISDAEYVLALAGQIKNMFATLSRRSQLEYNVSINGLDIKALAGADGFVSEVTQVASYLDNLFGEFTTFGHTHKGGSANINIQDILTYLDEYEQGLHKLSFIVGGDGIQTLNLDGIKKEDVSKVKELVTALNPDHLTSPLDYNKMKELQDIIFKFGGDKNALQMWNPEQFDDLAQYMYQVGINTMSALTPLEKMKALLDRTFGKGKIDYSKYEDLLSTLDSDNARNIYNQIASAEGLTVLDESAPLTIGQISQALDENIAKFKSLREEANLTYEDIKNEVAKVMDHLHNGGTTNKGLDFFKQYFPEGAWQEIRGMLTDAYDGLISVEEVQNRIAAEFSIDPDTFDKIPTGSAQATMASVQEAQEKLQAFMNTAARIQELDYVGNDIEIGKQIGDLEAARKELEALGQQGLLTALDLEQVGLAYDSAHQHLMGESKNYTGYGDYYSSYRDEYYDAINENDRLKQEIAAKEEEIDNLQKHQGAGNGDGQSSQNLAEEIALLEALSNKVNEVTTAVDLKTQAFTNEQTAVSAVIQQELNDLQELKEKLESIQTLITNLFSGIDGSWATNINEVYNKISQLGDKFAEIENQLRSLGSDFNMTAESGNNDGQFTVKMDTSSMENALVNTENVIGNAVSDIRGEMINLELDIQNLAEVIKRDNKTGTLSDKDQKVESMKKNILQLFDVVNKHNSKTDFEHDLPTEQELSAAVFADGSISVNHGEHGSVPWKFSIESLLSNLSSQLVMDLHSHPWSTVFDRQHMEVYRAANDVFSGSTGDLSAFRTSKNLGAQIAAMLTGNIVRTLDLNKMSDRYRGFVHHLKNVEQEYVDHPEYGKYVIRNEDSGKLALKGQNSLQGTHELMEVVRSMMFEALKRAGFSDKEIFDDIYKEYNLTEDQDVTALASRLVDLSSAAQTASSQAEQLKNILNSFGARQNVEDVDTMLEGFRKGELTAADVWNRLSSTKVSQDSIDAVLKINSEQEAPAEMQLLSQMASTLESINAAVVDIVANTQQTIDEQLQIGADQLATVIAKDSLYGLTKNNSRQSPFENLTEFKAQELFVEAEQSMSILQTKLQNLSKQSDISTTDVHELLKDYKYAANSNTKAFQAADLYQSAYNSAPLISDNTGEQLDMTLNSNIERLQRDLAEQVLSYIEQVREKMAAGLSSTDGNHTLDTMQRRLISVRREAEEIAEQLFTSQLDAVLDGDKEKRGMLGYIRGSILGFTDNDSLHRLQTSGEIVNQETGEIQELDDIFQIITQFESQYNESLQFVKDYLQQVMSQFNLQSNLLPNQDSSQSDLMADAATYSNADAASVRNETAALEELRIVLEQVEQAVLNKTQAFMDEGVTVGQVIDGESQALTSLYTTLNAILSTVDLITEKFNQLNTTELNINTGNLEAILDKLNVAGTPSENSNYAIGENANISMIGDQLIELERITNMPLKQVLSNYEHLDEGIKSEVNSILQSLGLLNDNMELTFGTAKGGNASAFIGDGFVILQKTIESSVEFTDTLIRKLNEAKQAGINVAPISQRVFSSLFENNGEQYRPGYEIQHRASGEPVHVEQGGVKNLNKALDENISILQQSDKHLEKFIQDWLELDKIGLQIDPSKGGNFLLDSKDGFTFIDLTLKDATDRAKDLKTIFYEITTMLSNVKGYNQLDNNPELVASSSDIITSVANVFEKRGLASRSDLDSWIFERYNDMFGIGIQHSTSSGTDNVPSSASGNSYALETTLQSTNEILSRIEGKINDNQSFADLIEPLNNATAELKNVANGIIEEHKRKAVDTRDADARLADPKTSEDIKQKALDAVRGKAVEGGTLDVTEMKALADGAVKVSGYIQTATDKWEGFTLQVDKAGEVSKTTYSANAKAAKEAQKLAQETAEAAQEAEKAADNDAGKKTTDIIEKLAAQKAKERELQKTIGQVNLEKGTLGFNFNARGLDAEQTEIVGLYDALIAEVDKYEIAVKEGYQAELDGINKAKDALFEKIDAYKTAHNIMDAGTTGNKKAYGATVVRNAKTKYQSLSNTANTTELQNSVVATAALEKYTAAYERLINLQATYKVGQKLTTDEEQEFNDARVACNEYAKEVERLLKLHQKSKDEGDLSKRYELESDFQDTDIGRQQAFKEFLDQYDSSSVTFEKFDDNFNKMIYTVNNGDGTFTRMTATINNTRTAIDTVAGEAKEAKGAFAAFFDEVKGKFKSISAYLISSLSIHEVWQQVRKGIEYVKEIDSALTELKKVTDETDASYSRFLQDMSKTAGVIGSTVSELTTMAAEWARLGYSMEEAGKLAESTAILLNVSEFTDATKASEALISTMQAFSYTADESQHVVDILNEVGNNFAVSSDGIATALQDSASALMEGGNNLEQAVALVAAANRVVQDPNSVGSALRTISLRLRGTSVEVLEEMGEETDGAIESVSKLQEKIKAISGVDILTDAGDYKDTYTILKEIGTVWEEMSDIDQAALLELMAGKNRANTLSAILSNMKDLEGAYESAMNAEGSALRENEAYLDSIQGRLDLFTNALQTLWMNVLDTNVIKGIVDIGTTLLNFLDTFIGKITAAAAAYMVFQKFKNGKAFADQFRTLADGAEAVYSSIMSMVTATQTVTKADIARTLAAKGVNTQLVAQIIAESTLKGVKTALTAEQIKAAAATLTEKFRTDELTASQYMAAMSTMGLKTALEALGRVLLKNPIYLVTAGVVALAAAFDYFNTTATEAADAAHEAFEEIRGVVDSTQSTIQSLESELSTLQSKIDELNGNNLSFADSQELEKLKAQREELEHSLKVQQQLLELQNDSKNKQAVATMKAYTKASSEGAEQTQKSWQTALTVLGGLVGVAGVVASVLIPGDFGTVGAGGIAAGKAIAAKAGQAIISTKGIAAIAGGAYAGSKFGESAGSAAASNAGTFVAWYDTYTKALETSRKEEQKALKDYQKDSSNIDKLDKWQEAQKKTSDIETEMYNHLSQMQQYFNGMEYGDSEEINKELDAWYTFLDKFSIDQGASGAEVTALDRIFGENASEEIKELREQFKGADQDFDFETAINSSQELSNKLAYIGLNAEDVKNYFTQIGEAAQAAAAAEVTPVTSYADLLTTLESFNEIQSQTEEIIINNTKVTQEYKDALVELVGSEEEVNEYFDENNKLIVKDAKGLNKLVQTTRKNAASTAALAKSQARLQYAEMYQELRKLVNGQAVSNTARLQEIVTLYHEMNAIERTIARYSALEHQLLGTTNAYEKFAQAQEIDAQTDYLSSAADMVKAIGDAITTSKFGTETALVAIEAFIPDSVYKDLDSASEQAKAIQEYFKENLSKYFTIEYDDNGAITSTDIKLGNIRKFVEDGLASGVFTGDDWTHFELSEDITSIEEFAEKFGQTKEFVFAFLEGLEDYDVEKLGGDYVSLLEQLLPDTLETKIYKNISALADLEMQLATGKISASEYASTYATLIAEEAKLADSAREEAAAWYEKTEQLEAYKVQLQEYQNQLETGTDSDGNIIDPSQVQQNVDEISGKIKTLAEELETLEEPTELTLQIALDDLQTELDTLEKTLEDRGIDINAHVKWDDNNNEWTVSDKSELQNDTDVQQYVELKNDQTNLESLVDESILTTDEHLSNIEEITQGIYELLGGESKDKDNMKENSEPNVDKVEDGASENVDGFKAKASELFNTTLPAAWDEFWNNISGFFDGIGEWAEELKQSIATFFTDTLPKKWGEFWNGVSEFFSEVSAQAAILRQSITEFFTETIPEKWDEFWDSVDTFFTESLPYAIGYAAGAVTRFFTETIPAKLEEFITKANELGPAIEAWGIQAQEKVAAFLASIPEKCEELLTKAYEAWLNIGVWGDQVLAKINDFFNSIPEKCSEMFSKASEVWTGIDAWVSGVIEKINNFFNDLPTKMSDFWTSVGTYLDETVGTTLTKINTDLTTFFTTTLPDFFNNLFKSIGTWISEKASLFWQNLTAGFGDGKNGDEGGESGTAEVNGTAHAKGTVRTGKSYKSGDWGLPQSEHNSLVGELGPEMVVDPHSGRYYTVGDNGAEMVDLPKGAIIFNHKQTEGLLNNGHITSRGKAYAEGNAHLTIYPQGSSKDQWKGTGYSSWDDPIWDAADALSDAAGDLSDAADDFEDVFDWIEVRLEEIDDKLAIQAAQLENAVGADAKNAIIDDMIKGNQVKYENLIAGAQKYYDYAANALNDVPAQFRDAAQNGAIAITEFKGKVSEEGYNAIQEYREWVQKGDEATRQAEETITEIRDLAVQAFNNIGEEYDVKNGVREARNGKIEAAMGLAEEKGESGSKAFYNALIANSNELIDQKTEERNKKQAELDNLVALGPENGGIAKYSKEWREMVTDIFNLDEEILGLQTDVESYKNAIEEIDFDAFDEARNRLQNVSDEAQDLIDLLSEEDLFDENGVWTDEGITTIGLYGQQMESAKLQAESYAEEIAYLNKLKADGAIGEQEYNERMAEATKGQRDAVKAYNDAADAIYDVQKARVESIKKGIDKEIDAYEKLIAKKKESLSADKDTHDFTKSAMEHQKTISDIERRLAAIAGDNSMAANAERARLQAELAEAKAEQEEFYYDRSVSNQQEALDKSLENYTDEKEKEKEELDKWLEDTTKVVADAFTTMSETISKAMQDNINIVGQVLDGLAEKYGITLSDGIVKPWEDGLTTMDQYWESFTKSESDAKDALETNVLDPLDEALADSEKDGKDTVNALKEQNKKTMEKKNPSKPGKGSGKDDKKDDKGGTKEAPKVGSSVTVKTSATNFSAKSGNKKMASFVPGGKYTVYQTSGTGNNTQVLIGKNGVYTGWVKLTDLKGYASGTTGVKKDQLAWIDELGEELVMHADGSGKLAFLSKGSAVIPHDISENLLQLGQLDPTDMLEQNRPSVGVHPEIHNTEINLDCSVGALVHIEHCDQGTLPDVEKMVNKAFDKHMQTLNNNLKRYTR